MKLLNIILPCIMAVTPTCTFSDSGHLINERDINEVYLCVQNESEYKENITVKVKTGSEEISLIPTVNYGYDPSVFLGDFLGSGLDQIFYSVNSGGSGAYSSSQLISLKNAKPNTVYDSENFKNTATATLEGQLIKIEYLNQNLYLDASNTDLSGNREVVVTDVNTVMPVYNGGLEKYQLLQFQKVYIDYTANNVGYLTSIIDISESGAKIVSVGTFTNFI